VRFAAIVALTDESRARDLDILQMEGEDVSLYFPLFAMRFNAPLRLFALVGSGCRTMLCLAAVLVAACSFGQTIVLPADYYSAWPTMRGMPNLFISYPDPTKSMLYSGAGLSPFCGANGTVLWETPIDTGNQYLSNSSSPVIGGNLAIYVCGNTKLYALLPSTGAVLWSYDLGSKVTASPVVAPNGNIYIGAGNTFYEFDFNGNLIATANTQGDIYSSGAIVLDSSNEFKGIAFGDYSGAGLLYTPATQGFETLVQASSGFTAPFTFVGTQGSLPVIIMPSSDGTLYNLAFGSSTAPFSTAFTPTLQSPVAVISENNSAYEFANGSDGNLYGAESNGTMFDIWDLLLGFDGNTLGVVPSLVSGPAIAPNLLIVVGSYDQGVYAFTPYFGPAYWTFSTNAPVQGSPAIASDGTVYIGPGDKNIYALNGATGKLLWSVPVPVASASSPAIGQDGTLYVNAGDRVIAIGACHLNDLSFNATAVTEGTGITGTVTLDSPAPANGLAVALSCPDSTLKIPATVRIPGGATSANFKLTTPGVGSPTVETVTASFNLNPYALASFTIEPPAVATLSLPASVVGGTTGQGTVTLASAAPTGGVTVNLSSSSSVLSVPTTISVAAGSKTGTFTVTASAVDSAASAKITVSSDSRGSATGTVSVTPAGLASVTVPAAVTGGNAAQGTVTLNGTAGPSGVTVTLLSNNKAATVPASLSVPGGSSSATFSITTTAVTTNATVTISASEGSTTETAQLSVQGAAIAGVTFNPTTVIGGNSALGTVTLTGPAPTGGLKLSYVVTAGTAKGQKQSLSIPAGSRSAAFSVPTKSVTEAATYSVDVSLGSATTNATFQALQLVVTSVTVSPSTVASGASCQATITLNGPTPSNTTVTYKCIIGNQTLTTGSVTAKKGAQVVLAKFNAPAFFDNTATIFAAQIGSTPMQTCPLTVQKATITLSVTPAIVKLPSSGKATFNFTVSLPKGSKASSTVPCVIEWNLVSSTLNSVYTTVKFPAQENSVAGSQIIQLTAAQLSAAKGDLTIEVSAVCSASKSNNVTVNIK
jgi:outer membrane protein assembly factor BamB